MLDFFKGLATDPRIPSRDKKLSLIFIILVISPLDIIPDWFPIVGQLDDLAFIALLGDYYFRILDPEIVLGRWPYGMKSFQRVKRFLEMLSAPLPRFLRDRIWKFKMSPYRN
jgi:hypothetical protein